MTDGAASALGGVAYATIPVLVDDLLKVAARVGRLIGLCVSIVSGTPLLATESVRGIAQDASGEIIEHFVRAMIRNGNGEQWCEDNQDPARDTDAPSRHLGETSGRGRANMSPQRETSGDRLDAATMANCRRPDGVRPVYLGYLRPRDDPRGLGPLLRPDRSESDPVSRDWATRLD